MAVELRGRAANDWPMSREEKKHHILSLYSDDVRAADNMLSSGESALEALREELDAVRRAAGVRKKTSASAKNSKSPGGQGETAGPLTPTTPPSPGRDREVERLRCAVESAAAVLRAILPPSDADDETDENEKGMQSCLTKPRARSEHAIRENGVVPARPALCRTPRNSGTPRKRVSWGSEPEQEPHDLTPDRNYEDARRNVPVLEKPPMRKNISCEAQDKLPATPRYRKCDAPSSSAGRKGIASHGDSEQRSNGTNVKIHLMWVTVGLVLTCTLSCLAFKMGSQTPAPVNQVGNPVCWHSGFTYDTCCRGTRGNHVCWDRTHTYERCCFPLRR